jgi:hypothetical protein
MTTIRLAVGGSPRVLIDTFSKLTATKRPALLCSYVYLDLLERYGRTWKYRDWVLDSGAYSVMTKGIHISVHEYVDTCKRLLDSPNPPTEIYALDVIDDWRQSLKNTEQMWKMGIEAIPCYHAGEPQEALVGMARDYPKIAIGGMARMGRGNARIAWLEQCFARVWPKKVHAFALTTRRWLMAVPWHSADSSAWSLRPKGFGFWNAFGRKQLSVRGNEFDLRAEVAHYVELEDELRGLWGEILKELD